MKKKIQEKKKIHFSGLYVPVTVHREQNMKTENPKRCNN
jgi:hypothetical protein